MSSGTQQLVRKLAAVDAQIGLDDVHRRQPGVLMHLFGNLLPGGRIELRALHQRLQVISSREVFDLLQEGLQIGGLLRQLVVIPRGGCITGQAQRRKYCWPRD